MGEGNIRAHNFSVSSGMAVLPLLGDAPNNWSALDNAARRIQVSLVAKGFSQPVVVRATLRE